MKNVRELNVNLIVEYPDGYGSEARGDLDDLEERILTWVKREVSATNEKNRGTRYHEEIHITAQIR